MKIKISDLRFQAIIGILDFERLAPQDVIIDARLSYKFTSHEFVNYAEVADVIKNHIIEQRFELIEEALISLSQLLTSRFPLIKKMSITLTKPSILPDCSVSVTYKSKNKS
ncbi:MAG: dihydroneopterin aldolase [Epsilonproteobacteria bacterium]|nr:dihydroneopterin aldolase [Campylobacterota bacterium]